MKGKNKSEKPATTTVWEDDSKKQTEVMKDMAIKQLGCSHISISLQPQKRETPAPEDETPGVFNISSILRDIDTALDSIPAPKKAPVKGPKKQCGPVPKKGSSSVKYYWQFIEQEDIPTTAFTITPKDFFDKEGCLSDEHFEEENGDIPEEFSNVMESTFEFDGTRAEAEAILRANPLFEEKQMNPGGNEDE